MSKHRYSVLTNSEKIVTGSLWWKETHYKYMYQLFEYEIGKSETKKLVYESYDSDSVAYALEAFQKLDDKKYPD